MVLVEYRNNNRPSHSNTLLNVVHRPIMAAEPEKILQPIDPEFEHKLDAEYVKFHRANLLYRPRADQIPWSPATRDTPAVIGTSDPLPVGSIVDYDLGKCKVRVFTPEGEPPTDGWPVFIFFHGGE
jgi:acetyl esterase/lipase